MDLLETHPSWILFETALRVGQIYAGGLKTDENRARKTNVYENMQVRY